MKRADVVNEARKLGISQQQAEDLWEALQSSESKLDVTHVLYYFGALTIMIAMIWFVGSAWDTLSGQQVTAIALGYMLFFLALGTYLWNKTGYKIPGGLSVAVAVCLVPLLVYGIQRWTGWWVFDTPGEYRDFGQWVRSGWFVMEVATLLAGLLALFFFSFPFLVVPTAMILWFLVMDITPLLFGDHPDARMWVSFGYGFLLILVSYVLDLKGKRDHAFWGYLFGVVALSIGSYVLLDKESMVQRTLFLLLNLILMILAILLQRNIFLIAGGIGIFSYLSTLFYSYFENSFFFPIAISLLGLAMILSGVVFHKYREAFEKHLHALIPNSLKQWLP